jgi:hypothetical protein
MARFFLLLFLMVCSNNPCSAAIEKTYFLGEVKLSSADGKPMGSQVLLVEKTQDPEKNLIVDRAIVVQPDGIAEEHTMNMTVQGNSFTLKDTANTVTGAGDFFGPAWQWTYWKGSFQSSNGVRIEDENFLADPGVVVARKRIIGPDGKVLMYQDVTVKQITPRTFEILSAALLKR